MFIDLVEIIDSRHGRFGDGGHSHREYSEQGAAQLGHRFTTPDRKLEN